MTVERTFSLICGRVSSENTLIASVRSVNQDATPASIRVKLRGLQHHTLTCTQWAMFEYVHTRRFEFNDDILSIKNMPKILVNIHIKHEDVYTIVQMKAMENHHD